MKLKSITPEQFPRKSWNGKPSIRFCTKGTIVLSKRLCATLELKEGDSIILTQDEERPDDYYICKSEGGFKLRKYTSGLIFNNSGLAKSLLGRFEITDKSFVFSVSSEPIEYGGNKMFAIITRKARAAAKTGAKREPYTEGIR